ncbi:MAG: T9SS type A sorting domain-containing protein [Ferruginibacter sp.]
MKTNFTIYCLAFLALSLSSVPANSQTSSQYNFNAAPVLISGTANQVNAKYRFANVSTGIDAIITIMSSTNGATVDILDDNAITKPEGFSPKIGVPRNRTGLVEFQICFVASGTLNSMVQDSLNATAIDIDGGPTVKEMDVIDLGGGFSSYQVGTPEITVTQTGTAFTGKNVAGNEYDGIDTAARQVMFTVTNTHVGCFTYKCGAANTGNSTVSRQKSIYFKSFTYPPPGPLPVKYLSFDAVAANKSVGLKWVTVWEMNNGHFEVERSFDRNNFKTIAMVLDGFTGADNNKTYQYKDNAAEIQGRTIIYYRLKQIDIDGRVDYSNILAVRMDGKAGATTMQVSPNPFVKDMMVRFNATVDGASEIRIINMLGQPVLSRKSIVSKGYNNIQLTDLDKLIPGIYVAQLIIDGVVIENQKVVRN